jgi:hypothetical protein
MIGIPISVPFGGVAGYALLQRRMDDNLAQVARAPQVTRKLQYFRDNIRNADSPEALMGDYRLAKMVLTAYGLGEEIGKKAFVEKVMEQGTDDPNSFANRLRDHRFQAMAKGVGFGNIGGSRTLFNKFKDEIEQGYLQQTLEEAVGASDDGLRLAINFQRRIGSIASGGAVENAGWFQIMGELPLRRVVEGAFGLPTSFGLIDLDQQRAVLTKRTKELFGGTGSPAALANPENADKMIRRFLAISQATGGSGATSTLPPSGALTLLSSIAGGGNGGIFAASLLLARI